MTFMPVQEQEGTSALANNATFLEAVTATNMAGVTAIAVGGLAPGTECNGHTVSPVQGDLPSTLLCPFLLNEPPVAGAYFDVQGTKDQLS